MFSLTKREYCSTPCPQGVRWQTKVACPARETTCVTILGVATLPQGEFSLTHFEGNVGLPIQFCTMPEEDFMHHAVASWQ